MKILIIDDKPENLYLLMPHVSGWDVLDSIKNNTKTKDIPVVIVSAADVSDKEKKKLAQKTIAFIDKRTFNLDEFEKLLDKVLSGNTN